MEKEIMVDGVGVELESSIPFLLSCCDCGLTHKCVIVSQDGEPVGFAVERVDTREDTKPSDKQ